VADVLESAITQDRPRPAGPHCGLAEVLADPWLDDLRRTEWAE
jgi:hypothetical protein